MRAGWKEVILEDLGFVGRGKSKHRPRNADFLYGDKYPFIQTADVKAADYKITSYSQMYSEAGLKQSKLWNEGTLCITIAANIADAAILGIKACFPDSIIGFVADEKKSDVRFVKYSFDLLQKRIKKISQGTAQDNLSMAKLRTIKLLVPSLKTQRKIAQILSAYDDLIENNLRRIALLEEQAQLTYEEWFVRLRFPGFEEVEVVEGLPVGWRKVKLKDYLKFNQGVQVSLENQYLIKTKERTRFIRIVDVTQGNQELRYISTPKESQMVTEKDIFMIRYGTPKVVTNFKGALANNFFKINIKSFGDVLPKYLFSFLNRKSIQDYLMGISVSATMPAISFKSFGQIEIILPTLDLQRKYHDYVENIFETILNLQTQNRLLQEGRDILLPRLMLGVVDVEEVSGQVVEEVVKD